MLTIGQLAAHVGVTVRAVRHYHQHGLLAEPARDASGYRRYDAQAVVDLIRIKTLAAAGVPLARIDELLNAQPDEFAKAIARIDQALEDKIRDLTRHRHRIAELAAGERLFLPAEIVDILDRLRALGVSERMVRIERDVWILAVALSPQDVSAWVAGKNAVFDDLDFQRVYLACDEAFDWDRSDPRLHELAAAIADWEARRGEEQSRTETVGLMFSHVIDSSPAWQRALELLPGELAKREKRL
ncbi:MerR family transcriptional regulator [Nonomuraea sp. NPDC049141]|uniref:MerR family transcriptional regulator n=1 Tax=unclassified Nonomuraea TaxID=2593643 RepID=UPI0033D7EDFB